jgi:hypothetical protein
MNSIQESKLTMYRAVALCCTKYATIIPTVSAFIQIRGDLTTNIAGIDALLPLLSDPATGITEDKYSLKDQMCRLTVNIASAIYALAALRQDNTLRQQVNYSFSDLMRIADENVAAVCLSIHDLADGLATELAIYGITEDIITDQGGAITSYETKRTLPRQAIESKAARRQELSALFKTTDELLREQMDKAIVAYCPLHPDFFNEYNTSRTIFDPPTVHTTLTGTLLDHLGNPVEDAEVSITSPNFSRTTLTDEDGLYSMTAKSGTFHLTAKHNNEAIYEKSNLKIKQGQINHLNINLLTV